MGITNIMLIKRNHIKRVYNYGSIDIKIKNTGKTKTKVLKLG